MNVSSNVTKRGDEAVEGGTVGQTALFPRSDFEYEPRKDRAPLRHDDVVYGEVVGQTSLLRPLPGSTEHVDPHISLTSLDPSLSLSRFVGIPFRLNEIGMRLSPSTGGSSFLGSMGSKPDRIFGHLREILVGLLSKTFLASPPTSS